MIGDVLNVFKLLNCKYVDANLGNVTDPPDEVVYILLTLRTGEKYYQLAFSNLRIIAPKWEDLLNITHEEVAAAIAPSGLATKKADQLKGIAAQ